ncbi:MAG: cation:proton antiporter, partial [Desulfobacteraceae bacterium]
LAAEIGIVLLFFILGLEFPLERMVEVSKRVAPAGLMDVLINLGGAMGLGILFGLAPMSAFTLGAVCYATSSSITAKMLEEQKRLANPEAEFILALLIFEDLISPLLVSFIAEAATGDEMTAASAGLLMGKILLLVAGAVAMGHYGFKKLNSFISRHIQKEFMPLLTIGVALLYAGIAMSMGLSEILGAFLAGVMLSESGKSSDLEHLILPVRDVTLPFFFFWFGTTISLGEGIPMVWLLILVLIWSAAGKILVGYAGGLMFGLTPKISCRAGFSLVSRGEFSAIIASLAPSQMRVISGIFILASAFVGVYLFQKAPAVANWYHERIGKKVGK